MCAGNSNIACKSDIAWQSLLAEVLKPSLGVGNITARSANQKDNIMDTQWQAICLTAFEVISMKALLQNCAVLYSRGAHTVCLAICTNCSPQQTDWGALKRLRLHGSTSVMLILGMLC